MRTIKLVLALLAAVALIAACGSDSSDDDQTGSETTDRTDGSDDRSELDGTVAAVVDGDQISAASIDGHVEALATNPQFAEQLEGPDGEQARAQLRAQLLSSAVQTSVVSAGADELGEPVTDEDLRAARAEIEEQAGGAEGLEETMEAQGFTEDLLEMELRTVAAMSNIAEVLDEQAGDDPPADTTPDGTGQSAEELSPSEQRVQEFLMERVSSADVTVHPDFGQWNPQTGQVVATGGPATPGAGG